MHKHSHSNNSTGHRYPVTSPMYKALRRDIERLVASNSKLSADCVSNTRRWTELKRDFEELHRLFR